MSATELFQLFGGAGAGVVGVCIVVVCLFLSGQIVTRREHNEMREERDEWKKTAEINQARSESQEVTGRIVRDVMQGLRKELE